MLPMASILSTALTRSIALSASNAVASSSFAGARVCGGSTLRYTVTAVPAPCSDQLISHIASDSSSMKLGSVPGAKGTMTPITRMSLPVSSCTAMRDVSSAENMRLER